MAKILAFQHYFMYSFSTKMRKCVFLQRYCQQGQIIQCHCQTKILQQHYSFNGKITRLSNLHFQNFVGVMKLGQEQDRCMFL